MRYIEPRRRSDMSQSNHALREVIAVAERLPRVDDCVSVMMMTSVLVVVRLARDSGRRHDSENHRNGDGLHPILLADHPDGWFLSVESGVSATERRWRWEDVAADRRAQDNH